MHHYKNKHIFKQRKTNVYRKITRAQIKIQQHDNSTTTHWQDE